MITQYAGGSIVGMAFANCKLDTTLTHMNELADLYADLWH